MRGTLLLPLTVLLVLAKLTGALDVSWFQVFLPAYVWLLVRVTLWTVVTFRMMRAARGLRYPPDQP